MTTYEEWRVTGTPGLRPHTSTFGSEGEARAFVERATVVGGWTDGPHLHRRNVTVTDWTEENA